MTSSPVNCEERGTVRSDVSQMPRISVIIPRRPEDSAEKALAALQAVEYPQEQIEVLLAEGNNPARQRNIAVEQAAGDILYFLDNDSEADIDLFRFAVRCLADPEVAVVGGPSEILPTDSFLQKCFGYVLGSFFAVANVRCRYKAIGRGPTRATEHKLILCNLAIRREIYVKEGGLDERLYPNEENEFLSRLRCNGHSLVYNPRAVVRRPHRTTFGRFVRQICSYGRGRMEQYLLRPEFVNVAYLMPLALLLYLFSLPLAIKTMGAESLRWYLVPAALYVFASGLSTARILIDEEDWKPLCVVPVLFATVHVSYAWGMLQGLVSHLWKAKRKRLPQSSPAIEITVIKPFGSCE